MTRGWALTPMMVLGLGLAEGRPAKAIDPPACLWDAAPPLAASPQAWEQSWMCGEKVSALIRRGDDADRERFWSILDELPEASPVRAPMIEAFLDWHLSRALEDLAGAPPPPAAGPPPMPPGAELPEHLKAAPTELQQAWWVFQQATHDEERARPRPAKGEGIAFQSNQPAFQRAVGGLLRGRTSPADAVRELTRFEWGGWCGTGSDSLYIPQSKALMIAYLRLRRIDLATAASAGLAGWMRRPEGPAPWDRRLVGAAGIDWEVFYLGGVVSGQVGFAETLARQGSDQAAHQLVTAARFLMMSAREESSDGLIWPLAALVERTRSCSDYGTGSSREVDRDPGAPPVSGSVQEEALELLAEKVGPGLEEADAASHLLVLLCRPESREAFRTMLGSSYSEVRRRGAIGLRGLGEAVAEPKASPPVAFRLLADGRPLVRQEVEWALNSESSRQSSRAQTDAEGILCLPRDWFLDPRRRVTSIVLGAGESTGLRFEVKLAPPQDLDRLTTVSVGGP